MAPADQVFVNRAPAAMPHQPTLMVVVDTEEEFDWTAPFSREATSVTAMRHVDRLQRLCDGVGLTPSYVIDYPVATQPMGYETLAGWAREGRCRIGAHLHSWVTPPFDEPLSGPNSFMRNLPPSLQHAKMRELYHAIVVNTGARPLVFKAGRYGISETALAAFDELGLAVDASINPCMNFAAEGGPDFSTFDSRPFWIDRARQLLEVPCTHGFVGWARRRGQWLRDAAASVPALRLPGILNRIGAVNRVMLSPEGNTLEEMVALTRALLADGVTVFTLTLHSPSLEPGHTPYVRSHADLSTLLAAIARYFEFFFGELGGTSSTPERFRQDLLGRVTA